MSQLLKAFLFLQTVSSQSVCIWGREGEGWDSAVNGMYIAAGTHNGKTKYSKSTPYDCPRGSGTMNIYWAIEYGLWQISDVIDPTTSTYAYCTAPSLSNCNSWYFLDFSTRIWVIDSSVSASFGSCPTHIWQCDQVHIPSLPYPCNQVFDNHISENLWTDSSATFYWYFDEDWFGWKCTDSHPSTCPGLYQAWSPSWNYIANGQSSELLFEYQGSYTVNCIMNPTLAPTPKPTQNPIPTTTRSPTPEPTSNPIATPTRAPSPAPTFPPSHRPTNIPSFTPTLHPVTFSQISVKLPTVQKPSDLAEGMVDERTTTMTTRWIPYDDDDIKKNKSHFLTFLLIGAALIGLCVFCLVIMCVYNHKPPQLKDGQIDNNVAHVVHVNDAPVHVAKNVVKNIELPMRDRVYTDSRYMDNDDDHAEEPGSYQPHLDIFHKVNGNSLSWESTPSQLNTSDGSHEIDFNGLVGGAVTEGADEQIIRNERNKKERELLKVWLTNKVRLPQYYDVLIENGYETLSIVKEITKEEELNEIGIVLKGHVKKLMAEIKVLGNYVE